jgi:hypothetical protein
MAPVLLEYGGSYEKRAASQQTLAPAGNSDFYLIEDDSQIS